MAKLQTSKLLFDDHPLVVIPELAKQIGLNEAIILQQVHYWVVVNSKKDHNYRDGYYWTYNTFKEWQSQFPFWSIRTIKTIVGNLERTGLLIPANYNKMRQDRTKWYRIDYDACTLQSAEFAPSRAEICTMEGEDVAPPLPETSTKTSAETTAEISSSDSRPDYFKSYESEIGILTPMIAESMKTDLETYPEEWLIDAIKVASSANKRSYRYVQGILRKWAADGRDVKPEDLSLEETIRARQVSSVVGRMEDIGKHAEQVLEVINRPEYSEEDINFLDSFILSNQSLYKIARCLRGETPASNGNLIIWRASLLKLGIEVKVPEKQGHQIDIKTPL